MNISLCNLAFSGTFVKSSQNTVMTDQEIKEACKFVIEHGQRDFTEAEKEMLKAAVDQSKNLSELFAVAIASLGLGRQ